MIRLPGGAAFDMKRQACPVSQKGVVGGAIGNHHMGAGRRTHPDPGQRQDAGCHSRIAQDNAQPGDVQPIRKVWRLVDLDMWHQFSPDSCPVKYMAASVKFPVLALDRPRKGRNNRAMTDHGPALRQTRRSLPIALLRARETVMGPIRDMLAPSGVNEQKWRVLRVLEEKGPQELSHVAAEACLLLPSLTRMIRPMEGEGLISRHTPPKDKRRVIVAITPAGAALLRAHAAEHQAIFARIESQFGADRLDQLLDLLEDLQALDLRQGR